MKSIMITGANSGLGKECARQLAQQPEIETIYLACRNAQKAEAARKELESVSGRNIFEVVIVDVADPSAVRDAVSVFDGTLDALVMNAGGLGGKDFLAPTPQGVSQMTASNLLGHVLLAETLLESGKLHGVVLYAGSEAARGVPRIGITRPVIKMGSVEEFIAINDGSRFAGDNDPMAAYAYVKLVGALWMGALARRYPDVRINTISPGHTGGTQVGEDLPGLKKAIFKFGFKVLPFFNMAHGLESGAGRYVQALGDDSYRSGIFYASKEKALAGPVVDQSTLFADIANPEYQDNARQALLHALK